VCSVDVNNLFTYFIDGAWFYLNDHVNVKKTDYGQQIILVWRAVVATRTVETTSYCYTINSERSSEKILVLFCLKRKKD
jgi:hypothetical protein